MSDLATSYSPAADAHTSYNSSNQSCLCAPRQWMAHTSPLCCPRKNSRSFHPSHSPPTSTQLWPSRVILGIHGGSLVKNSPAIQEMWRCGFNSESGRSPGEGNGNPLQYSCLENPMDRGAWRVTVHGVTKSQTRLSD